MGNQILGRDYDGWAVLRGDGEWELSGLGKSKKEAVGAYLASSHYDGHVPSTPLTDTYWRSCLGRGWRCYRIYISRADEEHTDG